RGHGERLTRKQEQAVAALLSLPTIGQAAASLDLNERTLRRGLAEPVFLAAYPEARRHRVQAAGAQLQQTAEDAAAALKRNLTCGKPGDEIRAALAVLERSLRAVEVMDLATELAELMQKLEELRHGHSDPDAGGSPNSGSPGPPNGGGGSAPGSA